MLVFLVSKVKNSNFERRNPLYMFPISLASISKFFDLEPERKEPALLGPGSMLGHLQDLKTPERR